MNKEEKKAHERALDKARGKRYRLAHPERVRAQRQATRAKRANIDKEYARQKRIDLMKSYVAQMLNIPTAFATPEIVDAERMRLKIKREIQERNKNRTEKKCSTCKEYKPLTAFSHTRRSIDGRSYECLLCKRERRRKDKEAKGLTYKPRKFDEHGRRVKHTPEELKAAKIAYYYANIETIRAKDRARNKQRKQNATHQ